ncbi:MAG TPA: amidohydrolase [Candidatus Acidoferrales bacterium]
MLRREAALLLGFLCVAGFLASSRAVERAPHIAQNTDAHSDGPADLILNEGLVYTMDKETPWVTAIAIRGEKIVAITDSPFAEPDALKAWIGPNTRVIDLHGQFVMPGFNDAHLHLADGAYSQLEVNVEGTKSLAEFQQRIRDRLKDFQPGEWIIAAGWDHTLWPEKKFPTRADLDAVTTTNPLLTTRIDGHVAAANSLALKLANITAKTPDPPGGRIERDPQTGEPTGMLDEDAAKDLVSKLIPPYSHAKRAQAFEKLFAYISQFGVTSVQDNSVIVADDSDNYGWENFLVYRELQQAGKLPIRITEWLPFEVPLARLEQMRKDGGTTDPWLKTGTLKEVVDGSLGARTAAMLAPYSDDPNATGILRIPPDKLTALAIERDRAGFQLAFHAIGDRTNRLALDTFAAVLAANGPRDRRDRVEHAQIVAPEDFARFAQMNIIASMQPAHLLTDQRWAIDRIGAQRAAGAYAWRTMQKDGVHLAFGTDFPVEAINPLRGIYSGVTRELPQGGPANGWQPQEKLTMKECLSAYTTGSAYAEFEEKTKGKIAKGMLADLVVFPGNVRQLPPYKLLKLKVSMTIAGGRIVYQNPKAPQPH